MSRKELCKRYLLLIAGVFFVGLGIAIARRSDLGISPVSSVANVLSLKWDIFSMGTWLMLWNCLIILMEIAILRRNFKPIQLLQFPISLLLGVCTDIGVWMVAVLPADGYVLRLLWILVSVPVLALGITLMVISNTVMNVGEAFVDVVSKVLHKSFGNVKVVFDISCVTLSVLLSLLLFDGTVVGTREGTFIAAFCTGLVVKWMTKRLKAPIEKCIIDTP